jgi:sulfur carrier protein ThiS
MSQNSSLGHFLKGLSLASDRVAVQIEGDVVGADHDAVARTIDEVAVERRIGGDRLAAADLDGLRCLSA